MFPIHKLINSSAILHSSNRIVVLSPPCETPTLSVLELKMGAAALQWAGLALALLVAISLASAQREQLRLGEPEERLRTDGGSIQTWSSIRAIRDANIEAARITLRERGLYLPSYSNSAVLKYVEEGEGYVGLLTGYSAGEASHVRRIRRGDVVAFPRGVAGWLYNSGSSELRIIGLAETSAGPYQGEYTSFSLAGAGRSEEEGERRRRVSPQELQNYGGILHGFRREFLADAWDLDERRVEQLLESQHGVGIVQLERDLDIPQIGRANRGEGGSASHRGHHTDPDLREYLATGEHVYNVREGSADVRVPDAGFYNSVNRFKLPILEAVNLGLTYGRLERDAILAPQWSPTGHEVVFFLRGNGRLEIVGSSGESLVDTDVREGEVYVIPRFHAHGVRAGEEGLEWISFYTTDQPLVEALAGRTSVLKNLPVEVAAAAADVDVEQIREARERRQREAILLPVPGRRRRSTGF